MIESMLERMLGRLPGIRQLLEPNEVPVFFEEDLDTQHLDKLIAENELRGLIALIQHDEGDTQTSALLQKKLHEYREMYGNPRHSDIQ